MAGGPEATGGRTIDVLRRQLAEARAERDQARARQAELVGELRESEARHALVSDAVAEGIYEWNIEDNALWVSQRLIGIFGFEGRELTARDWNELVHPEDFPSYRNALRDCFKGTTRRLDCEYRVKHADGAYRWVEDRAVPVRNAAGQALRLVGAVSDVTARKEGERALRELLEQRTATAEVCRPSTARKVTCSRCSTQSSTRRWRSVAPPSACSTLTTGSASIRSRPAACRRPMRDTGPSIPRITGPAPAPAA